jgi:predicted porin
MYMNKKLLSLAVASVLAGGFGAAQADVSVYGKAHVSWDYQNNDTATVGAKDTYSYVSDNSSRIGVKVSEDLGGGVKAIAQWEIATRTDESNTMSPNRNSFAGLSGGFGTVMLGKYDSPFKEIGRMPDQFNERVGDARNIIGNLGAWDRRPADMLRYQSPKFGGVVITGQYSNGDSAGGVARQGSANAVWSGGGANVGLAFNVQGVANGAGVTEGSETGMRLAGTFKVGGFTIGALFEQLADIGGVSGADRASMGVSGAFGFGNNVVKAQYFMTDEIDGSIETGGNIMAIGYDYNFSKATTGYVAYSVASNDANTALITPSSNNGGHGETVPGVTNGGSPNAFSVGLEMKF